MTLPAPSQLGRRWRSSSLAADECRSPRGTRPYPPFVSTWEQRVEHRFHSPRDYLDAARDPAADAELLAGLATVPYQFVHEAVAEHPNTRDETLLTLVPDALVNWGDHSLLRKVVAHPAADGAVFVLARQRIPRPLPLGSGRTARRSPSPPVAGCLRATSTLWGNFLGRPPGCGGGCSEASRLAAATESKCRSQLRM